jgi:uncharacterized protein (UPF0261 family)
MESPPPTVIGLSVGPRTRLAAQALRQRIEEAGYSVREFAADGTGGRGLEMAIRASEVSAVLDLTLTEVAADVLGRPNSAGPDRLTAAALMGVPQILAPGGLDQLSPRELDQVSKQIALKASAARGPCVILVPQDAWADNGDLDPENRRVFAECLRLWLAPQIALRMVTGVLGGPEFIEAAANILASFSYPAVAARYPSPEPMSARKPSSGA